MYTILILKVDGLYSEVQGGLLWVRKMFKNVFEKVLGVIHKACGHRRGISIKILSPNILDFYDFLLSKYWTSTRIFVEVQYFDKKIRGNPVFWDLEFL